jgi:hypothetical protein
MPISKEKRALYPSDWDAISKRIRRQAGNKCERCKAPNGQIVARGRGEDEGTYCLFDGGEVFDDETGKALGRARGSEYDAKRFVRIVLTVAHVDHDPSNNAESNLKAWCQKCHLAHDKGQHVASARATRLSRKAASNLPGIK